MRSREPSSQGNPWFQGVQGGHPSRSPLSIFLHSGPQLQGLFPLKVIQEQMSISETSGHIASYRCAVWQPKWQFKQYRHGRARPAGLFPWLGAGLRNAPASLFLMRHNLPFCCSGTFWSTGGSSSIVVRHLLVMTEGSSPEHPSIILEAATRSPSACSWSLPFHWFTNQEERKTHS